MASYNPPLKGVQYIFYIALFDSTGSIVASPTIAAGDFKVSIDGAALANPATLPTNTPAASGQVKITLSTSEMNGDNIIVKWEDPDSTWGDGLICIQTAAVQFDTLVDAIWDEPLTQPSSTFAWAGSFRNLMNWLGAVSRNKMTQTATTTTLRNDADNADLSTSTVSKAAGVTTRGEWT